VGSSESGSPAGHNDAASGLCASQARDRNQEIPRHRSAAANFELNDCASNQDDPEPGPGRPGYSFGKEQAPEDDADGREERDARRKQLGEVDGEQIDVDPVGAQRRHAKTAEEPAVSSQRPCSVGGVGHGAGSQAAWRRGLRPRESDATRTSAPCSAIEATILSVTELGRWRWRQSTEPTTVRAVLRSRASGQRPSAPRKGGLLRSSATRRDPCRIEKQAKNSTRTWRNWQTHQIQVLAG
jgi:hypothetical protein